MRRARPQSLRLPLHILLLPVLLFLAGLACATEAGPSDPDVGSSPTGPTGAPSSLGDGFVVWESNRTGDWRIFRRAFADAPDGPAEQVSPDEPDLQHCCPHLSPDGRKLVYLARRAPKDRYPETEVAGELRLIELGPSGKPVSGEAGTGRTLAPARTYGWGDRAAVWRNDDELVFVTGDGRTALLELGSGKVTPLTTEPRAELGWLLDPTLSWATHAAPVFAPYDRAARRVAPRPEMGGCEPYFSHDGRYGVFMPAGGGPIRRLDLASREPATLIERDDPRLEGQGYLYFPMPSRDGRLLAFGASRGDHSHFTSDYDVFVVPTDPRTLEPTGPPVRLTRHPATDRYPDVHLAPLPLGRHAGEAPLTVAFPGTAPEGEARWDYGDGTAETAARGRHVYRAPGTYAVTAAWGDSTFRGLVVVEEPAPPEVVRAVLRGAGSRAEVHFDEPVDLSNTRAALVSGGKVAEVTAGEGGRSAVVRFAAPVTAADTLTLEGVRDRAEPPHEMPAVRLPLEPPTWPSARADLLFLWRDAAADNRIEDPVRGIDRVDDVTPRGRARLDRRQRMDLTGGGSFDAPRGTARELVRAVRESFEVTLIATVTPESPRTEGLRPIVEIGNGGVNRDLVLGQDGRRLVAWVRAASTGAAPNDPDARLEIGEVEPGKPVHVAVTYEPGELTVYRDGDRAGQTFAVQGGLRPWKDLPLVFGSGEGWRGTIEGVALYARALPPEEIAEDAARYAVVRGEQGGEPENRKPGGEEERGEREGGSEAGARGLVVRATLTAASEPPTLVEISPYREALVVHEYRLDEVVAGSDPGRRLRIARWAILDGETQAAARPEPGSTARLRLSPLADNPQLESVFVKDTLDPAWDLDVYYGEPVED